jgi:CarD family transcriptional regulator
MFEVGDLIFYGKEGICKVGAVGMLDVAGIGKDRLYYTLCPVYNNGRIFIPVDANVTMRPVITREEANRLIQRIREMALRSCGDDPEGEYPALQQAFDFSDPAQLVRAVYGKKDASNPYGKKPGYMDVRFMKLAEDLLYGELAAVLGIPKGNVRAHIEESAFNAAK